QKVASIGIAVRRWVSWHGIALNVNNDLALAQGIRPCGFAPETLTTLARLAGAPLPLEALKSALIRQFRAWWQSDD
ncbi:MAG: lipoate-protein ligase B, partial [Candidatus Sericytochromatia bacterium]